MWHVQSHMRWNPFGVESRIFQDNLVDAMVVDALAPCVARSSSTIVLNMQDKWNLGFCKEGFQLPVPFTVEKLLKMQIYFLLLSSLWPGDVKWWHKTGSTLAQVMAYCLTVPKLSPESVLSYHQLSLVAFTWGQFHRNWHKISVLDMNLKITNLRLPSRAQWVKL